MKGTSAETRERILDAAYELFYRRGFGRVGIDEIARKAGITKRSLYYHYKSKDDLLAVVMERHHALATARVRKWQSRYSGTADQVIDVLFEELAKWSLKPDWQGAGFTRVAMELADLPGHPARAIASRHKRAVETWYAELLSTAGVPSPAARARELMLLVEGATALVLIHGDRTVTAVAAAAAKRLIGGS